MLDDPLIEMGRLLIELLRVTTLDSIQATFTQHRFEETLIGPSAGVRPR